MIKQEELKMWDESLNQQFRNRDLLLHFKITGVKKLLFYLNVFKFSWCYFQSKWFNKNNIRFIKKDSVLKFFELGIQCIIKTV